MALPTKQGFFDKFLMAIVENDELKNAYFKRFGIAYLGKTSEEIGWQLIDKLSNYGGYEMRRRLIECVEIRPGDCVLDIGPEIGMECFLLAEVYHKVLVAEPDLQPRVSFQEFLLSNEVVYTDVLNNVSG